MDLSTGFPSSFCRMGMMQTGWQVFLLFLFGQVIFWAPAVSAWSAEGHEAIGMTAMSAVKASALTQLKRLLGGMDVVDVSSWAHKVNQQHPETIPLHFQIQPRELNCSELRLDRCPNGQCLVRVAQHFFMRLTGAPHPEAVTYPGRLKFTDADALKYLVNLIGDLHQPLHLGFETDNSGRLLNGSYFHEGVMQPTSLYDFWDNRLIHKMVKERGSFWYSGWTHVNSLRKQIINAEKEKWDGTELEKRHLLFEAWAKESLDFACSTAYWDRQSNAFIVPGFQFGMKVEYQGFEFIRQRLLIAGLRLSLVLNSVLEHRDAAKLRQGSAVVIRAESPLGGASMLHRRHWVRNLLINLSIVVLVVAFLLYATRFYSSPQTVYASIAHGAASVVKEKEMIEKRS